MNHTTSEAHSGLLEHAMRRALALATRGPAADPNPRVGCVLLDRDGEVVGEGWHEGAGAPHAEVAALAEAGSGARGGTAIVTLEPCNHTGRTGPCSQALLHAGIARVVHAQSDPNPLASGGAATLRAAGVEVSGGLLADQATALNRTWTFAQQHGRPFVTWKFAATLDGFSAAADGTSQWITREPMRAAMLRRRAECGAVLVGTGTVLADDPRMTSRDEAGQLAERQPWRVVLGVRDIPPAARVRGDDGRFVHLAHRDPDRSLQEVRELGVHHVWLEGGPRLAAAFWRAGLVDEVIACIAPALLGTGRPATADLGIGTIADIARLTTTEVIHEGEDFALVLQPNPGRTI